MEKNRIKTTLLLLALLMSLVLVACSSANTEEAANTNTTETTVDTPTSEPAAVEATEVPAAEPEPITLTDGLGNEITLAEPAQHIISLAPSNTEVLFAVGAGAQVVGRDAFSDYPEAALAITDIGGGFGELDMETILSLEPDLVMAADITPPEQIQALTDVGLTVFALPNPVELSAMYDNLRTVAQLTGHEAETETLIAELEARVTAVTEKVATATETPLVFYELDSTEVNAPWTSGPGTFVDTLITMSGGENVGGVLEGAWAQISIEELITQDPDIIILGDYTWGGVTPDAVAARDSWASLTAVQNGSVFTFDDNWVSRPGPRMVDGLEAMAQLLHPDLFE
ncbi:MAG: ABC transporter substrate-binding protein [Ardenticatenaceae bacterium]|nr:ABC transporter substrate-binding protein [Ardenticatenaceae bacterium]